MAQAFLLSSAAKTLKLSVVARMSEEEAFEAFKALRWDQTSGSPVCPRCGCFAIYSYRSRRIFKCKGCSHQFSATSGTIFASRKLAMRDILLAIAIFVNGAKGHSALQLSRDLSCNYRTAFVLSHKLREAMKAEPDSVVSGEVEIDGGYFGGHIKPRNYKTNRRDRRLVRNQNGKRKCVVIMRERNGRALPFVFSSEDQSLLEVHKRVALGSTIYADEAGHWESLHARYLTKQINHRFAYSDGDACTNWAESFFARMRRSEIGVHHKVAGRYLDAYASEMAWRENHRRVSNGEQYLIIANAALAAPVSRQWKGYWQRHLQTI